MQNERVFHDFPWIRIIALQKDPTNHLKIRQKDPVSIYFWRVSTWPPMAIKYFVVIFQCNHQTGLCERHLGIWKFRLSLMWRGWGGWGLLANPPVRLKMVKVGLGVGGIWGYWVFEGGLRWLLIVNQPSCADVLKGWVRRRLRWWWVGSLRKVVVDSQATRLSCCF